MLVGGVSARECDVPSLGMSPVGLGKSCSSSAFPDAEGICGAHVPAPEVSGGFPPCVFVSPRRGPSLGWEAA